MGTASKLDDALYRRESSRATQGAPKLTVAGNSGTVVAVNFRYTVPTSDETTIVHVPNSTMFDNSVIVESGSSAAR